MSRSRVSIVALTLAAVLGAVPAAAGASGTEAISPERLAGLSASPGHSLLVIDLRPEGDFTAGAIRGALHGDLDPAEFAPPGNTEAVVLVPTGDGEEGSVGGWIARLDSLGYHVMLLEGGPREWRDAGVAMQMPAPVYADPRAVSFVIPRGICETLPPLQEY